MTAWRVVNLAFQLGGNTALLRTAAEGVDVLGVVEARTFDNEPVDVAAALGDEWHVRQDTSSPARSGCAVAVRKGSEVILRGARLREMSRATTQVQTRYLLTARIRDHRRRVRLLLLHLPIPDTGVQDEALSVVVTAVRRIRRWGRFVRWIVMGDVNMDPDDFAAAIHAPHHFGDQPMDLAWSAGWGEVGTGKTQMPGTDHFVLTMRAQSA